MAPSSNVLRSLSSFAMLLCGCLCLWQCSQPSWVGQRYAQEKKGQQRPDPTTWLFQYPDKGKFTTETFYDFPFPHSLRLRQDGNPNYEAFPVPKREKSCQRPSSNNALVNSLVSSINPDQYLADIAKIANKQSQGFSLNPSIFFRFKRPLHPRSIPSPAATLTAESSFVLVDIDPKSPTQGKRIPLLIHPGLDSRFFPSPVTVLRPYDGFVLRPKTLYAAVILDRIRDKDGWPISPTQALIALNQDKAFAEPGKEALRQSYAPMFTFFRKQKSIDLQRLVAATVFRTGSPLMMQEKIRAQIRSMKAPSPPTKWSCSKNSQTTPYITCKGEYLSPAFQNGSSPFLEAGSGVFTQNKEGKFNVLMLPLRFALTIPKRYLSPDAVKARPMPTVMYGHGTGGSYVTFINNGVARKLANMGIAGFGIDQAVNGTRTLTLAGTRLDFLFFNALNLPAARDNIRQSAADYYWQTRFLQTVRFAYEGQSFRADPKKLWFMGHSQGGLTGPPVLALETGISAAYLSAPGGLIVNTLMHKVKPVEPILLPALVRYMLCDRDPKLQSFHPLLSVLQNFFDPADPVNYAPALLSPKRKRPLHLFMTEGLTDGYAPPQVFEPLAVAAGLPILGEVHKALPGLTMRGMSAYKLPVRGNFLHPSGQRVTVGFTQHPLCKYTSGRECDGHFVAFNNNNALRHWQTFFQSLVYDDIPQIQ